jgi:hypothetical protein
MQAIEARLGLTLLDRATRVALWHPREDDDVKSLR